jgi:gliding motility-associated-like protein
MQKQVIYLFLCCLLLVASADSFAQAPPLSPLTVEWQRTWGPSRDIERYVPYSYDVTVNVPKIYILPDSNYICVTTGVTGIAGETFSYNSNLGGTFIVCIGKNGKKLWQKQTKLIELNDFIPTSDGNFAILGQDDPAWGVPKPCLIKINAQGTEIWRKYYPQNWDARGNVSMVLKQSVDGGFLIGGGTGYANGTLSMIYPATNTNYLDAFVFKTNASGVMLWSKIFGGNADDYVSGIVEMPDASLVLAVTTRSIDGDLAGVAQQTWQYQFFDTWLCKMSATGNVLPGGRFLHGIGEDEVGSMSLTSDGYILLCGSSTSMEGDYPLNMGIIPVDPMYNLTPNLVGHLYLMKFDANLNTIWRKRKGGSALRDRGAWATEDTDGGYLTLGSSASTNYDVANNIHNQPNCAFNLWLMKWDKQGNVLWQKFLGPTAQPIQVIPTPDNGYLVLSFFDVSTFCFELYDEICQNWFYARCTIWITKLKTAAPPPHIDGNTLISCNASTTLTAVQDLPYPTPPVSYAWSTGDTTKTVNISASGGTQTYTVTITYDNHCTKEISQIVTVSGILSFTNTITSPAICTSASGSCTTLANGGIVPYTYQWSNNSITPTLNNLVAGVYTVTATDANGCTGSSTITIPQAASTLAATATTTPTGCAAATGTATITIQNGAAPYTYTWSDGTTTTTTTQPTLTGLAIKNPPSGGWGVTATDANGCTVSTTFTITQAANNLEATAAATQISCAGGTGSISVSVTNGIAPFTYSINGGASSANNVFSGLAAANYTVIATDFTGCTASSTATINVAPLPLSATIIPQNATCGLSNGSLTANISGGTAPYTYAWANGTNTTQPTLTGIAGQNPPLGGWGVTATDANTCTVSATATILSNPPITATITTTATKCYGEASGSIAISNVQNAVLPVLYSVDNQPLSATNPITNITGGTHTVKIEDATGCKLETTTIVAEGPRFTIAVGRDTLLAIGDSLYIEGNITSGFPVSPTQYVWTCSPEVRLKLKGISGAMAYVESSSSGGSGDILCTLVATDARGCTASDALTIRLKDASSIFIPNAFTPNGDGYNEEFVLFGGALVERVELLRIFDRWGELVHQKTDFAPNTPAWDGLFNSVGAVPRACPTSVYVYYTQIRMRNGELRTLTGDVTLLR